MFIEVASQAAQTIVPKKLGQELATRGFSAVFVEMSEETAKTITAHLVGPLLAVFLKAIDPTQRKLDSILIEPLQTGIRLSEQALAIKTRSPGDRKLRNQLLLSALESLEKAFSYSVNLKKTNEQPKIRLAQALIAKALDAHGATAMYAETSIREIQKERERWVPSLTKCKEASQKIRWDLYACDVRILEQCKRHPLFDEAVKSVKLQADVDGAIELRELTDKFLKEHPGIREGDLKSPGSRIVFKREIWTKFNKWPYFIEDRQQKMMSLLGVAYGLDPMNRAGVYRALGWTVREYTFQNLINPLDAEERFWTI